MRRPCPPVIAGAVEPALGGILALGVGPPDVQGVDPDPVPPVRMRGVTGQPGQPSLGRDVRREVGLPGVCRRRADVDDGAGGLARNQVGDHGLHQEERGLQVYCDVRVEQLGRGVQHRTPGGQPGRVDQAVHPAERRDHLSRASLCLGHVGRVGLDEQRFGPVRGELGDQRFTRFTAPAGERDNRTFPGHSPGDTRAKPRCATADQHHTLWQQAPLAAPFRLVHVYLLSRGVLSCGVCPRACSRRPPAPAAGIGGLEFGLQLLP